MRKLNIFTAKYLGYDILKLSYSSLKPGKKHAVCLSVESPAELGGGVMAVGDRLHTSDTRRRKG